MPFVPVPFAAPTYNTQQSADRVIDLMLRQGDVAAQGARAQGGIWGNAVAGLGQQAGAYLQQRQVQQAAQEQQAKDAQKHAAINDAIQSWDPKDPETGFKKLSGVLQDPVAAMHVTTGLMDLHKTFEQNKQGEVPTLEQTKARLMALGGLDKNVPGWFEQNYDTAYKSLAAGVDANFGYKMPPQPTPEAVQALHQFYDQATAPKPSEHVLGEGQILTDNTGKVIARGGVKTPKTLEEAAAANDTETYQRMLRAETERARATALAHAQGEAAGKPKETTTDYTPDVKTSPSGVKYLDTSAYLGAKERGDVQDWARKNGVKMLNKDGAGAIEDIDVALRNNAQIMGQIEAKLPKDALGRVIAGPSNKLERLFQTDDDLAAFASWRTAAIRNLRATAGSKGLRLNSAEIELAVENDIPKITDTIGVARRKLQNVESMLRNGETSLLGAAPAPSGPPAPAVGSPGSKYKIVSQ